MKDYVIVKSRTTNNCSVPVIFYTIDRSVDGIPDKRELSRSYVFQNFEAEIPLKMARILIKQQPKEFWIDKPVGGEKGADPKIIKRIKAKKEAFQGLDCPLCKFKGKTRAGIKAHIRIKHPDEWETYR